MHNCSDTLKLTTVYFISIFFEKCSKTIFVRLHRIISVFYIISLQNTVYKYILWTKEIKFNALTFCQCGIKTYLEHTETITYILPNVNVQCFSFVFWQCSSFGSLLSFTTLTTITSRSKKDNKYWYKKSKNKKKKQINIKM